MIDVKLFTERLDFIDARIKNKYERHKIENNSFLNKIYDDHLLINLIIDIDNPNTDPSAPCQCDGRKIKQTINKYFSSFVNEVEI